MPDARRALRRRTQNRRAAAMSSVSPAVRNARPGILRSISVVSRRPARTSSSLIRSRRYSTLVSDAENGVPLQRRVQLVERRLAVLAPGDDLGQHGVVVAGDFQPRQQRGVDADVPVRRRPGRARGIRHRQPVRQCRVHRAAPLRRRTAGSSAPGPRRRRGPPRRGRSARRRPAPTVSTSPAAMRTCHSTRSTPVTISVTGCSTWSRVFISMKKNSSGALSETRNSTVPAPV